MNESYSHAWDVTPDQAIAIQTRLRHEVIVEDRFGPIHFVAGVDVSYKRSDNLSRAVVVVLRFPDLQPVDQALYEHPTTFPYIPGLLSFREAYAVLKALESLSTPPDLVLCDGHGLAHPRRFGLACHVGLLSSLPAIGVAKRLLIGRHEPVPEEKGAWQPIRHDGEVIGAALCTRPGSHPIYVSIGHRVSLKSAVTLVMQCTTRYRLPETTRIAHRLASGN
jgi:deoxyribonuclease V